MHRLNDIKYRILATGNTEGKREILDRLKKLWMDTFEDSKAYVELVYDTSLGESIIVVCESKGGDLISSLLALPYTFRDSSGAIQTTGWYLCGLATVEEYRGRGIMGTMMSMAEKEILKAGGGFAFLIPADSRLELYYHRKGYLKGAHRTKIRIPKISIEDCSAARSFNNRRRSMDVPNAYQLYRIKWSEMEAEQQEGLISFLVHQERIEANAKTSEVLSLEHTRSDFETILRENEISGGEVLLLRKTGHNSPDKNSEYPNFATVALTFPQSDENGKRTIEIRKISGEIADTLELLFLISIDNRIDLYVDPWREKLIEAIKDNFSSKGGYDDTTSELESVSEQYIMVKDILGEPEEDTDKKTENSQESPESEISIFLSSHAKNLKYPIFRKAGESVSKRQFEESGEIVALDSAKITADLLLD